VNHHRELRNRSPRTVETYVHHLKEYARHFGQSPEKLGVDHAHRYILYLLHDKKASWPGYNQAVSALRLGWVGWWRIEFPKRKHPGAPGPWGWGPRFRPTAL
jgi:hypothetical protein